MRYLFKWGTYSLISTSFFSIIGCAEMSELRTPKGNLEFPAGKSGDCKIVMAFNVRSSMLK